MLLLLVGKYFCLHLKHQKTMANIYCEKVLSAEFVVCMVDYRCLVKTIIDS